MRPLNWDCPPPGLTASAGVDGAEAKAKERGPFFISARSPDLIGVLFLPCGGPAILLFSSLLHSRMHERTHERMHARIPHLFYLLGSLGAPGPRMVFAADRSVRRSFLAPSFVDAVFFPKEGVPPRGGVSRFAPNFGRLARPRKPTTACSGNSSSGSSSDRSSAALAWVRQPHTASSTAGPPAFGLV